MSKADAIHFFFQSGSVSLRNRTRLKSFILKLFQQEGMKLTSLNYIFCSDKFLLDINRQYLKHDFYTDIVTFDLSSQKNTIEAEIYISLDRVRDNAKTFGTTIDRELHRVIFHGALHLCGYRDKSKAEVRQMRTKEEYYLSKYLK
jgi:probable rRNA maturation factor